MSLYQLEKTPCPATLLLAEGSRLSGSVFLSECSPARTGPETVGDLLAETDPFLAFKDDAGRFLLVGKPHLSAVQGVLDRSSVPGFWSRRPVAIELSGGHRIEGLLLTEEGPGIRFSDALNAAAPWAAVEGDGSLFWVSKVHILTAEERKL